ncbi:MAG: GNAT family N-acetyltransferase [Acidiferrobacterales bacterium]
MSQNAELRLAKPADAAGIALMSRDLVEHGLPWSWNDVRVAKHVRCPDSVVLTAWAGRRLAGFAIMHFRDESAHLHLLAIDSGFQRLGIGCRLIEWLEESARVAGTFIVSLEVRARNQAARAFYRKLGYTEIACIPGYYRGCEDAVRMSRDLRLRSFIETS